MTVTLRALLLEARRAGYAVGAFNVSNLETAQAVVAAAGQQASPAILGISESAARYGGRALFSAVRALADDAAVPIVIHLDHHVDRELIKSGLRWGATSVMYDGSLLPLVDNVRETKWVVALARRHRASVEGEVGTIGGHEDGLDHGIRLAGATDAARYVRLTRVDAVALGLGTSHGLPVPNETIHLDVLDAYYQQSTTPVVLHGASNLPPALIRAGIRHGVTKINIDTQLRQAFTRSVREVIKNDESVINPRDYLKVGREAMQREVARLMKQFGSVNEAHALRRNR